MASRAALLVCLMVLWQPSEGAAVIWSPRETDLGAQPLPLPADPHRACGKPAFLRFTKVNTICKFTRDNPEPECCEALVNYFGMNSTKPSRNCFCVPEVWERLTAKAEYHLIQFDQLFKYCSNNNYIVPFYQHGKGYCSGGKDTYEPVVIPPAPATATSFSDWASRLHQDWLVLSAFITGTVAVPGFFVFLWPFIFDLALMAKENSAARKARQQSCSQAGQVP